MPEPVRVSINGTPVTVQHGTTVAAAVLRSGIASFRRSVSGEARGPLCGMGICFECRLTVDGNPHVRSCQVACKAGMEIVTDD
jgi:predicted molibdopterin-dependent oxidoreductase YjgC